MMSFWSQTDLNDIVLICIKIKNKKTKRRRFVSYRDKTTLFWLVGLLKKGNPSFCRQRENKKKMKWKKGEEEGEEEEGEEGEGDLPAPRRRRVVFSGSNSSR